MKRIICFLVVMLLCCCYSFSDLFQTKKEVVVKRYDKLMTANEAGFKDEKFYACVTETLGKTSDVTLTDEELATVEELICKNKGVVDVSGIEKLTNLTKLDLEKNNIENIDLSKNINLIEVTLSANKLSNIDISKNTNLVKFYASSNQLSSIDLSNNDSIERMDISSNKINSIDISNLTNLKAVALSANRISTLNVNTNALLESLYASSNLLSSIDITNNNNLINIDLADNSLSSIDVKDKTNLKYLKLSKNKLTSIDIKSNTLLEELTISGNKLTSIDLSNNTNLKELYISSNNLDNLDISKLSKLAHLNAVFNNFDNLVIDNPTNIIDLVVEADWIREYNFDEFTNMKSLRVVDYYIVPVYGTLFNKSNLSKYKASNVNYSEIVLYTDFNREGSSFVHSSDTVNGSLGSTLKYRVCATNISGYHNYCGGETVFDNITKIDVDDNVSVDGLGNYSGIVYYEGYREFKFINLTSDKYVIDEEKSIIEVGGDSNDVILSNINNNFKDSNLDIDKDKLRLSYNGEILREFTLNRVDNPATGITDTLIVIGILISGVIGIVIYRKRLVNEV